MTRIPHIQIGLFGLGTVGGSVYQLLEKSSQTIIQKLGYPIQIKKVFDPDASRFKSLGIPAGKAATTPEDIFNDPDISIIVELIGDRPVAKEVILSALNAGKHLVTANKAILAQYGPEIYEAAHRNEVDILFEAAVAGSIPILRSIREGFISDQIDSVLGIINGTANYILTEMDERGADFASALKEAQAKGFAEADPTADIEGHDSAHKIIILTALTYGQFVPLKNILVEGISKITALDFDMARRFQKKIKLLAIANRDGDQVDVRVHPAMIDEDHILASVKGAFNAVMVRGQALGDSLLYGLGAGGLPTATAVIGDIIEIARNIALRVPGVPPLGFPIEAMKKAKLKPIEEITSAYYLRVTALDKPGVFSKIATLLGENQISIASVYQHGREVGSQVPIVIFTHETLEKNVAKALKEIDRLPHVDGKTVVLRVVH